MKMKIAAAAVIPFVTVLVLHSSVLAQPATTTQSVWDGIYTEEQAERGKTLYAEACASCHGSQLTGGEMAPALAGGEFLGGWDGLTVGDVFERIRVSMPQNAPGTLSGQQNADIVAYIMSANKFPTGTTELPKEAGVLKEIKLEAKKP